MATAYYRVDIIESESGWGQKLAGQRFFLEKQHALDFVTNYNARNTAATAPDWYMQASAPRLTDTLPEGAVVVDLPAPPGI